MKMNKKTIIVLIVVAVAVYLLWKKGKGETANTGTDAAPSGYNPDSLDDCITVAFGSDQYAEAFAAEARKIYNHYNSTMTLRDDYQAKAAKKGYTFAQMAVIDGAYVKCYKKVDGVWKPRDAAHKAYFQKVVSRIQAMN